MLWFSFNDNFNCYLGDGLMTRIIQTMRRNQLVPGSGLQNDLTEAYSKLILCKNWFDWAFIAIVLTRDENLEGCNNCICLRFVLSNSFYYVDIDRWTIVSARDRYTILVLLAWTVVVHFTLLKVVAERLSMWQISHFLMVFRIDLPSK